MQDILDMTVPIVVETSGRTERAYDIFSRLLKDRIVLLGSEVNDPVASLICAQLLSSNRRTRKRKFTSTSTAPAVPSRLAWLSMIP